MRRISLNVENLVQINGGVNMPFAAFQAICEETGYENPFTDGSPCLYDLDEGYSEVNLEGHIDAPDGKKRPEYEIFIKHIDNILKINSKLNEAREIEEVAALPNLSKRRLSLERGGYGTLTEQLDILAKGGIVGFQKHRADIDFKFPDGE